jgi:hypothetical protein
MCTWGDEMGEYMHLEWLNVRESVEFQVIV